MGSLKEKLADWWESTTNFWRCRLVLRRIKHFIAWAPVIWRDEDWDSAYLYEIMRFKISRIRKETERAARYVGYEKDAKQMRIVELILQRHVLDGENFYYNLGESYKERDGVCACPEEVFAFERLPNGCSKMVFHFCDFCEKNRKRWHDEEYKKQKADLKFCMEMIGRHSRKWWS